ncbi:MAG: hypothetical protein ACXABV_08730 [Candidatus Thorarchaeota archaeon]|jgi:hypothetical protein
MKPDKTNDIRLINCTKIWCEETVQVGERFAYLFHRHGSVGEDAEFEIDDDTVIYLEETEAEYVNPENMKKPGWTGGDAERGRWIFQALRPGKTILTIRIMFRFEVEEEQRIEFTVVF